MNDLNAKSETQWMLASGIELESSASLPAARAATGALPSSGASWGPFQVEEVLGRGASACVFRVRFQGDDYALKVLLNLTQRSEQRLAREVRIVSQLRHPGIVTLHGAGRVGGCPFVLYELVPGARSLSAAWATLPTAERVELVLRVANAMAYAHGCGVVHRDLKPANILVDDAGFPRVVDFGLARDEDAAELTRSGSWVGTPSYMAPEQFDASRTGQTSAVDVWSLGVLLYEALTERLPFHAKSVLELMTQVLNSEPPPPSRFSPEVGPEIDSVCMTALRKDPAQRFPDARGFAQSLHLRDLSGRRRPWWPLVVVALAVVACGAWALTAGDPPAPAPEPASDPPPPPDPFARLTPGEAVLEWGPEALLIRADERLAHAPDDLTARYARGLAHNRLGDHRAALRECEQILGVDADHVDALALRAGSLYSVGELAAAELTAERGLELAPERAELWVVHSLLAAGTGDAALANERAARALELDPRDPSAHSAQGMALDLLGDLPAALRHYDQALEIDDNPNTHFSRGRALLRMRRPREAVRDFEATLEAWPDDEAAHCLRLRALSDAGDSSSLSEAEALIKRFPKSAQASLTLAAVYQRNAMYEESRAALERTIELDTEGSFARAARDALSRMGGR